MEQLFTAVVISLFIMMGCTLFVLFWEIIDKQKQKYKRAVGVDLESDLYQKLIKFLDTDDEEIVANYIEKTVINHLLHGGIK